jgi:assimilatory nitrate reductase catalytic subunit
VQQLGAQLKCGTNCGSCIPELKKIIAGQLTSLTAGDDQ